MRPEVLDLKYHEEQGEPKTHLLLIRKAINAFREKKRKKIIMRLNELGLEQDLVQHLSHIDVDTYYKYQEPRYQNNTEVLGESAYEAALSYIEYGEGPEEEFILKFTEIQH